MQIGIQAVNAIAIVPLGPHLKIAGLWYKYTMGLSQSWRLTCICGILTLCSIQRGISYSWPIEPSCEKLNKDRQ